MDVISALRRGAAIKPAEYPPIGRWIAIVDGKPHYFEDTEVRRLVMNGTLERRGIEYVLARSIHPIRIFVVCTPKSGSSFVVTLLQNLTGFGHHNPILSGEPQLEADPDAASLRAQPNPAVSQLHCYAKPRTIELCAEFGIRPIFLTRGVFDSLWSMKEYIDAVDHRSVFPYYYTLPTEAEKRSFIVGVYAPIFVRMVASWREAKGPILRTTYESFFADPRAGTKAMIAHLGLDYSDDRIGSAIEATQRETGTIKFNKGMPGRGRLHFTHDEQMQVERLVASFGNCCAL